MRKKRHPLYPEPGAWIAGNTKGLPEINPPEHIKIKNLSVEDVAQLVEYEGLGFCVLGYISSEKITDTGLKNRWEVARKALASIVKYLDESSTPKARRAKPKKVKLGRKL